MFIKIGFWNSNGMNRDKCKNEDFIRIISAYDIMCLTETWENNDVSNSNIIIPSGYKAFRHSRKDKHKKAKRYSGGIIVLYKQYLHK